MKDWLLANTELLVSRSDLGSYGPPCSAMAMVDAKRGEGEEVIINGTVLGRLELFPGIDRSPIGGVDFMSILHHFSITPILPFR